MFAFPVLSNMLGVIQGCANRRASRQQALEKGRMPTLRAYFEHEPPAEADTADLLCTIREAWAERESSRREDASGGHVQQEAGYANHVGWDKVDKRFNMHGCHTSPIIPRADPESSSTEVRPRGGIGLPMCSTCCSSFVLLRNSIIFAKRPANLTELSPGPLKTRAIIALTLSFFEMCRCRMLAENKGHRPISGGFRPLSCRQFHTVRDISEEPGLL